MVEVVSPVLQTYVAAAGVEDAVSTTEPPSQKVVGPPAVMVTTGVGLTVTSTGEVAEPVQPLMSVIVTLYEPDCDTVMVDVVSPVLQT